MQFEIGKGLYDRLLLTQTGGDGVSGEVVDRHEIESWREFLDTELLREVSTPVEFELRPPSPDFLGSIGVGDEPLDRGSPVLWRFEPDRAIPRGPSFVPKGPQPLEPDSQIRRINRRGATAREVSETRLYGWPLRCMSVHGVRTQRWETADATRNDLIVVVQDDHWTDALIRFAPHPSWGFDADRPPATGLPWKPLWLPFLANSLILGVPLTLAGVGVSRAARAGLAKFRGRGDRCPRCGYPRKGLARGAACPECGGG